MKKTTLLIFLLSVVFVNKSFGQTADTTLNKLLAIDAASFEGKPLDSLIAVLPADSIQMKIVASHHRYTIRLLRVKYANEVWIELHVREFTHMNPVDKNYNWDINLLRKENLFKAVIYKDNDCYLNCDIM